MFGTVASKASARYIGKASGRARLQSVGWIVLSVLTGLAVGCGGGNSSSSKPPSNLTYPQASITATVGQAISPDVPTVTGSVTSYSITPALPAGLTLNTSTGAISGTPTASSPQASYSVSAHNVAGSTSATLQVMVKVAPPSNLAYVQTTISAAAGLEIMPDIPSVTGTVTSYNVSPALPAGLSLDPSMGVIYGTPSAASAQTSYTVTAQNPGGASSATITISVAEAQNTLLDLGHVNQIQTIRMTADRVLSVDYPGHWVLWNYTSGAILANGDGSPYQVSLEATILTVNQTAMAGQIFVIAIPAGLEIRATSDGHLMAVVAYPGLNQVPTPGSPPWWQLASDGSYVCIGSQAGLAFYGPAGQSLGSKSGDYSLAKTFAAPGNVLVALGPAGQSVIETVSVPGGASSTSAAFSGQFNSWFVDGARFLTNLADTVYVYSSAGVQQAVVALPSIENLTGQGNWIWTFAASAVDSPVDVYAIGSETPALSMTGNTSGTVIGSGSTIGVLSYGAGQVSVIDLSGSTPTRADYTDAIAYMGAYGANSASQWVVGNEHGALIDGASLATTARYFGYGAAWSIAGSSGPVAISTASGKILIFDPSGPTLEQTIEFSSGKVALSTDGTVLGASANANDAQYEADRTLNFYSLPSDTVIKSYPYTFQEGQPYLLDFTLAGSGTTIAQITNTLVNSSVETFVREVTPLMGGSVIWSDAPVSPGPQVPTGAPILLSPDGTLIDAWAGGSDNTYATNILKNGKLVTAIPGVALGWIDNSRILVNQYALASGGAYVQYSGAAIYDSTGAKIATPALPELKSIQTVTSDSVYDPSHNAIYSLTTGQPTWTGAFPGSGLGAVAGAHVVHESGHSIVMESY